MEDSNIGNLVKGVMLFAAMKALSGCGSAPQENYDDNDTRIYTAEDGSTVTETRRRSTSRTTSYAAPTDRVRRGTFMGGHMVDEIAAMDFRVAAGIESGQLEAEVIPVPGGYRMSVEGSMYGPADEDIVSGFCRDADVNRDGQVTSREGRNWYRKWSNDYAQRKLAGQEGARGADSAQNRHNLNNSGRR